MRVDAWAGGSAVGGSEMGAGWASPGSSKQAGKRLWQAANHSVPARKLCFAHHKHHLQQVHQKERVLAGSEPAATRAMDRRPMDLPHVQPWQV